MKKAIVFCVGALLISSTAFAGAFKPEVVSNDDAGGIGVVAAYTETKPGTRKGTFKYTGKPVKTMSCEPSRKVAGQQIYSYSKCGDALKAEMKSSWCKDNKGKSWYYRIGREDAALPNTCPKK